MTNKTAYVVSLAVGALIGSSATWIFAKKYYEKLTRDEIDSVKKEFSKRNNPEDPVEPDEKTTEMDQYNAVVNNYDYTSHSNDKKSVEKEDKMTEVFEEGIEYIEPDEYGERIDYEQISLTYFADKVLADEDTLDIIEDVKGTVGEFFADHFGEYEDDSVFVRNDLTRCEYEILADTRKYTDAYSEMYGRVANRAFDRD